MNIALVAQEYPPETARGGIGSQTFTKAQGLSSLGHNVFVISRSIDSLRHESIEGFVTVIRIPGMDHLMECMTDAVQWLTHGIVVAAELEALHKKNSLDIIDFPEWGAEGYTYLLNRKEWDRIPVVIQLHGPLVMFAHALGWPDIHSEFYRIGTHMEATCVQLADAVYSSSQCSAQWIQSYYNPQKAQIKVIHTGIDVNIFSPQSVMKNERPTIIFIGKIVENKGVIELVEAACQLINEFPDLQLKLIGRGDEFLISQLKKLAIQSGAENLLDIPGYIHKEDLPVELSKAHMFAAPSHYEGGPGFVFLEAMACGLPVIGCTGSGVEDIVTSGVNGILVPPKDIIALRSALKKLLHDKDLAEQLGSNAHQYVMKEAGSQECLHKLEAFYLSVLHSHQIKTAIQIE
jgi:glycosyltransferase involved in cell wall biosynthesis